jgi:MFS family permease
MAAGISYTIRTPSARWLVFTVTGALYWGMIQPIIPYYARDVLEVGSAGYGLLLGLSGAGSMASAIFMFLAGDLPRKGLMVLGSVAVVSLSYSLFAISGSFPLSLATMCVAGVAGGVWMTAVFSLLQTAVDDNMRGRVMGLALSAIQFHGFGFILGGFLAETIGAEMTLHITAALWFLSGLLAFVRSPEMRNLN